MLLTDEPETLKHPVTETLHGETITDNYRWLEQQRDPATRTWIDEQNAYTESYLQQVTIRPEIKAELAKLERVESYSIPIKRAELYFFKKRLANENQGSIYVRHGVGGADERLVDAATLSADQNTSVGMLDVTNDGSMLAYGVRQGGADEQEVHLMDVATRKELPDHLSSQRYLGVQISPDKKGLYYAVFHHSGTLVYWHAFGTEQADDKVIFGKEYKGEPLGELDLIGVSTSDNGHWLILSIGRGVPAKREDILLKDLRQPDAPVIPLIYGIDNRFNLIDTGTDTFLVETDMGASKRRILRADPDTPPQQWQTVVPEAKDVIEASTVLGGKLFVERLVDVKNEISIYSLDGRAEGSLKLPGIGSATVPYGRPLAKEGFYSFNSFNVPPTIYRYEVGYGLDQRLRATESSVSSRSLRGAAGLPEFEGWNAGADVHRGQEGPAAEWQDASADDRLRRLQRQHDARMEPDVCMVAGAGWLVCRAKPARRRRVRRGLAQGRYVREANRMFSMISSRRLAI